MELDNKNKIADMQEIAERLTDIIRYPGVYDVTAEEQLYAMEILSDVLNSIEE